VVWFELKDHRSQLGLGIKLNVWSITQKRMDLKCSSGVVLG